MNKLRTLIIDDEHLSVETLGYFLKNQCPEVELVGSFTEPLLALDYLQKYDIDLLILDIEMPQLNGFDLLQKLRPFSFEVIFLTAYNEFALKAFRFSAFDYLLKPLDEETLVETLERLSQKKQLLANETRLEYLFDLIKPNTAKISRIALPTIEGFEFIDLENIIRFESDSNYVKIFTTSQKPMMVCKTLKEMEALLLESNFVRVHNSHLVHVSFVEKYLKKDGGWLIMKDGSEIPVSRLRKELTLSKLNIA